MFPRRTPALRFEQFLPSQQHEKPRKSKDLGDPATALKQPQGGLNRPNKPAGFLGASRPVSDHGAWLRLRIFCMADDAADEVLPSLDPSSAATGPRRSTFTPPQERLPESVAIPLTAAEETPQLDDDALADALAADFARANTGVIHLPVAKLELPKLGAPTESDADAEPSAQPSAEPSAQPVAEHPIGSPPPAAPPTSVEPGWSAAAPWSDLPAPDPSQAVALPDPNDRPVRKSMPDDELVHWVDDASHEPGATLDAITQLESQLALREADAKEFQNWESRMRSVGTPDATAAVEDVRTEFTDVLPETRVAGGIGAVAEPAPGPDAAPETDQASEASQEPNEPEVQAVPWLADAEPAEADHAPDNSGVAAGLAFDELIAPAVEAVPPSIFTTQELEPEPDLRLAPERELVTDPNFAAPISVEPTPVEPTSAELVDSPPEYNAPAEAAHVEAAPADSAPEAVDHDLPDHEPPIYDIPVAEPASAYSPVFRAEADGLSEPEPSAETPVVVPFATYADAPPPAMAAAGDALADPAPPQLPAWEIPPPGPNWAPAPSDDVETAPRPAASAEDGDVTPDSGAESDEPLAASGPWGQGDEPGESPTPNPWQPAVATTILDETSPEPERTWIGQFEEPAEPAAAPEETAAPEALAEPEAPEATAAPDEMTAPEESADPEAPAAPEAPPEPEKFEVPIGPVAPIPIPEVDSEPSPPPLVEPEAHGPPLLPSQVAGRAPTIAVDYGSMPPPTAGTAVPATLVAPPGFDDLIGEPDASHPDPDEQPSLYRGSEHEPAATLVGPIDIDPLPTAAGGSAPTNTGTIPVVAPNYQSELPDDVDETDRVFAGVIGPVAVGTSGVAVAAVAAHPPSGPIPTTRIPADETVVVNNEPVRSRVFSFEESGLEPTPIDQRVGRAARLFWLWFAANSSILSLGLGAAVVAVGMNLRQSILAILAGVALSFIPLGLTTLAGKRSGQPTMVVSRATFGIVGNIVPAVMALVTRLFWGAVLLWLLGSSVAIILVGTRLDGGLGDRKLLVLSLAVAFLVALLVAFAGYPLFARIQLVLSIISGALVIGLIALTWQYVDFSAALSTPDGSWLLTLSGAVLVFSFVGLVWANSGSDLARYQRPSTSGGASMLWATFGTTLPTFILIGYGALLAASDKGLASGFLIAPLDTLRHLLPGWYPIPLLAATCLSLLSGVILTLYSGGFALQSIGVHVRRQWSIVIVGVLLGGLALLLTFGVTGGMNGLFRDAATTVAVPTAVWAGLFAAETMIRDRRFEPHSLLTRGGVYADVRWGNFIALFVISAIGYGLTTATVSWLSWQGYGFILLGIPLQGDLAASDFGVLVALGLGLLFPVLFGIRAIRRQEAVIVQATRVDNVNF